MDPVAQTLDHFDARLRQVEARVAQVQDQVGFYGPPKERPLLVVRPPRFAVLSRGQTTMLVYALLFGSVGVYMLAKLKKGDDPLS